MNNANRRESPAGFVLKNAFKGLNDSPMHPSKPGKNITKGCFRRHLAKKKGYPGDFFACEPDDK